MKIQIRQCDDMKIINWLNKRIFPCEPLELEGINLFWVAWHKANPVGFCQLEICDFDPDYGYFQRAGVLAHYRGIGIHSRMISVRKRACLENGLLGAKTYTLTSNTKSAINLMKRGFEIYRPAVYWAGPEVVYFCWNNKKPICAA